MIMAYRRPGTVEEGRSIVFLLVPSPDGQTIASRHIAIPSDPSSPPTNRIRKNKIKS
ncbi:hypothetical protein P170DRAFT_416156 [Aspergillus steynii IBT 23096]|uniref:Uncharacterized protein n=1 Tax=Aspergillus steynii IBT 23096 TaxID=1392250 RepID=A0A2I2FWZ3_9EURO|nr:uncharacterized protein P170DRAFT_416156 [Aspergillus steynii IBT 23096]PLB45161.1 hypothetical protein P170DRAFT_416156 [Aspergillus steynii IBT 23096]